MISLLRYFGYLILISIYSFLILAILYCWLGLFKEIFHDKLEWHKPSNMIRFRGPNLYSKCKICGKEIMMDSQGHWFEVRRDGEQNILHKSL